MPPAGSLVVGRKLTKVSIKQEKPDKPVEWNLPGTWLGEEGNRISLFRPDSLASKVSDRDSPLYKLLDSLWPHDDVDHIIVDQKSERCIRFQLRPKSGLVLRDIGALITAAIRESGDFDPSLR